MAITSVTVALITLTVLGVAGCGGDDDETTATSVEPIVASTGVSVTTVGDLPETSDPEPSDAQRNSAPTEATNGAETDEQAAQAALLVLSDFPSGWSEVPNAEPTDEEADFLRSTAECVNSDRSRLADLGGAMAGTGDFTSPSDETVTETVSFAPSVAEAEDLLVRFAAPDVADCYAQAVADYVGQNLSDVTIGDVTVARLNVAEAGDELVAYRVTIPVIADDGSSAEVYGDQVLLRSGRAVAGLSFQSQFSPFFSEDTDKYVALAAARLAATS